FGAAVVFDDVPLGEEGLPRAGLYLGQDVAYRAHVGGIGDGLIAGPFQHLRQLAAQRPDRPADRIAVGDRVHAAMHAHAAADAAGGRQRGVLRTIDVASFEVEAV